MNGLVVFSRSKTCCLRTFLQSRGFRSMIKTEKGKDKKEGKTMRYVYIRGILALIWFVCAVVCVISGNFEMIIFYLAMGIVFAYSAYTTWKKEKNHKGGR